MSFTTIDSCRLCHEPKLSLIVDFGFSPLANSYASKIDEYQERFPLSISQCESCGHVQLNQNIDPEKLFSNYLYASSDSPSLVSHFKEYAEDVQERFPTCQKILEVGCNDGILLKQLETLGYTNLIGIEPATNIFNIAKNNVKAHLYNDFFNLSSSISIKKTVGACDIVCANNVFAHVADLDNLTKGITHILNKNGVFIFENAYLLDTIQGLYFDQIYHEHLQYYGIKPLVAFLARYDMDIFDISHVETQGGSFRIFAKFKSNYDQAISPNVKRWIAMEEAFGLYERETYSAFVHRIIGLRKQLQNIISDIRKKNGSISCYGCPAKFALFSKFFELCRENIEYVVDDSPLKQGKFSPGANIPIVSRSHFLASPTDYCIISSWNMADAIMAKNQEYKGKFIIPMPQPKIV